jgi:DNA-binding NarL/FixJ family response regulator
MAQGRGDTHSGDAIAVGIIEDDDDLRAYLSSVVAGAPGLRLAFAAGSLAEAARNLRGSADVCLIDIQLPDGNGLDFARRLKAETDAKALILTVLGDRESVFAALEAGADGYLLKDTPPEQIVRDIKSAVAGAAPVSPRAAAHLLQAFKRQSKSAKIASPLTERESQLLRLFAQGKSYKEAAAELGVSANTIGAHVKAIYGKLHVNSRGRALYEAGQAGWLDDEPDGA